MQSYPITIKECSLKHLVDSLDKFVLLQNTSACSISTNRVSEATPVTAFVPLQ